MTILEENLTREEYQALQNKRAGMFIFQVSWIMAFLCMVMVNWQMRFSSEWLPPGAEKISPVVGSIATVALFISIVLARRSLIAIKADDGRAFLTQWMGALGLGGLFIALMLYEWFAVPTGTQYAQVFRLMTGFHVFHAVAIGLYMANVYLNGQKGLYGSSGFWAVEAGVKLWYFVFAAWILFYIVIYWI